MSNDLQKYLKEALTKYQIPGASIALFKDGIVSTAAGGVANLNTGVKITTDSIFQIGSITKVFTTCLVMQIVEEGRIDLDNPVRQYLSDFQIADDHASNTITVRQLLNHTSGIEGDFFPDDEGHQGNLIARYVDRCSLLPLMHRVGEKISYSNASFVIAGRLVEVVRGISWYQAMKDYIFQPLGLTHAIADPKDMIRYRAAMGHVLDQTEKNDQWTLPDQAFWSVGMAPAGTTAAMTATDLITFAKAHLSNRVSCFAKGWLSASSIKAMQTPCHEWPLQSQIKRNHVGLGWMISDYGEPIARVVHHGGATRGFLSTLQILPEQNIAFAILLNGFDPNAMSAMSDELLQDVMGIDAIEPEVRSDNFATLDCFPYLLGHYESLDSKIDVVAEQAHILVTITAKLDPVPPQVFVLKHVGNHCFSTHRADGSKGPNISYVFNDKDDHSYLFYGVRLVPKQSH